MAVAGLVPALLTAQQGGRQLTAQQAALREAAGLDTRGLTAEAQSRLQRLIDSADTPAARAAAERAMAMSFAFEGNCKKTVEYEEKVIAYWKTREADEPQNAFYQQGEMANEAARVCVDAGDLATGEHYYRRGSDLGNMEPEPRTHPKSLWEYRLAHALGRIAARRGNAAEARAQVANARRILDGDSAMAAQQDRYFPYLKGYVALYTGDLTTAERELNTAVSLQGNQRDPFMHALLAMTYERMGKADMARTMYERAFSLATSHNPPAAYVRPLARQKLGRRAPDPEQ